MELHHPQMLDIPIMVLSLGHAAAGTKMFLTRSNDPIDGAAALLFSPIY